MSKERIEKLKKLIRDNKAFNKEYKKEIKELEAEIINTVHIKDGDYTEAQIKDVLLTFGNS